MRFWIGVACSSHVYTGVKGSFAQLGHGKHSAVKNLCQGDWIAYYSPRKEIQDPKSSVQQFTAIGQVTSSEAYQVTTTNDNDDAFCPWRVNVDYITAAKPAPIRPLLKELDLTMDKGSKWGMAFRSSKIRGTDRDLITIATSMGVDTSALFSRRIFG